MTGLALRGVRPRGRAFRPSCGRAVVRSCGRAVV